MAHGQTSFSDIEHQSSRKKTRRAEFLSIMDEIIVWDEWVATIRPAYYTSGGKGRPARDLEVMLRMYLMQIWFNLSDVGVEEACTDIWPMRRFLKLSDTDAEVPDATTLANFRHIIEKNKLDKVLFNALNSTLTEAGVMWRGGTIADATFIEAPSSTKNKSGERDPEMHQAKKGKNWHFGMKTHIGMDAGTGLAHSITTTTANVADIVEAHKLIRPDDESVYLDAGYVGIQKREEIVSDKHLRNIDYRVMPRQSTIKTSPDKEIYSRIASMRAKGEHIFHVIKDIFGYRKCAYKGIAKNTTRLTMCTLLANIYLVAKANRRLDGTALKAT